MQRSSVSSGPSMGIQSTIRLHYPRVALTDVGFTQGPRPLFYDRSLSQPVPPLDIPTYTFELENQVLAQINGRRSAVEVEQVERESKRLAKIEKQRAEAERLRLAELKKQEEIRAAQAAAAAAEVAAKRAEEERIERELQAKRDAEKAKLKAELERMEALKAQLEQQEREDAERERVRQERLAQETKHPSNPISMPVIPAPAYQADRMDISPSVSVSVSAAPSLTQTNTINSFKNVTGVFNDAQCAQLLSLLSWDLNRAIAMFFDEGAIEKAISKAQLVAATRAQAQQPIVIPVAKQQTTLKILFPDNSMLSADFNEDDTLWIVTERVASHIAQQSSSSSCHSLPPAYGSVTPNTVQWHAMVNGNFSLVCLHPYQVYSESHLNQTLKEAGLVPNGTLRVQQGVGR